MNKPVSISARRGLYFLLAAVKQAFARAVGIIFPPICIGCSAATEAHRALCPTCWSGITFIERPFCEVLGTPFEFDFGEGMVSAAALANPPAFARARSAVIHQGLALKLASRLKYGDRTELALPMAAWMARAGADLLAQADLIVPVPLHRWRFIRRRFNQSAELGRALRRLSGLPMPGRALVRRKRTRTQVGLGRAERQANVAGAFAVTRSGAAQVKGRCVLLVDDVFTTGATADSAARCLLSAGADRVLVLTFSRVAMGHSRPHM